MKTTGGGGDDWSSHGYLLKGHYGSFIVLVGQKDTGGSYYITSDLFYYANSTNYIKLGRLSTLVSLEWFFSVCCL